MITIAKTTFDTNIARVEYLVSIYKNNLQGTGKGRRGTKKTDVLRAATVFLHASLEDFLRTLMIWKYTSSDNHDIFKLIPLKGMNQNRNVSKFWLSDLLDHRGKTIDEVLNDSVSEYANTYSFNKTTQINAILENCNIICTENITGTYPILDEMISRRHNIVHQADKDDRPGSGNYNVKSIGVKTIEKWIKQVKRFVSEVLSSLDD